MSAVIADDVLLTPASSRTGAKGEDRVANDFKIELTLNPIDGTGQKLYLVGTQQGTLGKIKLDGKLNDAVVRVSRVVVSVDRLAAGAIDLTLAHPVDVPGGLVSATGTLRTADDLNNELGLLSQAERTRFFALMAEAQRRLLTVEIDIEAEGTAFLGVVTPFGPAGAFAGGHIRVSLWSITRKASPQIELHVTASLAAYASIAVDGQIRTLALVCLIDVGAGARLRCDIDDFNLSLPEFKLPSFTIAESPLLDLAGSLSGAVGVFGRLAAKKVTVTCGNGPPQLALRVRPDGHGIDWALVAPGFDPKTNWAADPAAFEAKLASFTVKAKVQGAGPEILNFGIDGVKLAHVDGRAIVTGEPEVSAGTSIRVKPDTRRFGPLEIAWHGVTATPRVLAGGMSNMLRCTVAFDRLELRVGEDPDAVLAFKGKIELTPSGTRLLDLELIDPFRIPLVIPKDDELMRGAGAIVRVVADFAGLGEAQAAQLLKIIGKIAAAAGRSILFVADAGGKALGEVADLVARGLAGVAELVGEAIKALASLAKGVGNSSFALELRIATDPFALRQILLTFRDDSLRSSRQIDALGFTIKIGGGWHPGLLVDIAGQPGAYLIAIQEKTGTPEVATISTDLWLKQKEGTEPLRDAEGKGTESGERSKTEPLLSLTLTPNDGNVSPTVIVLAGLAGGRGLFLHQLKGKTTAVFPPLPLPGGVTLSTVSGPLALVPIDSGFKCSVDFKADRVLPLLGMGEPGKESGNSSGNEPSFLDKLKGSLSNVVWVRRTEKHPVDLAKREAEFDLVLGLKAAGLETEITLKAALSLDSFELKFTAGNEFPIRSKRIEERALGLTWIVEQANASERKADAQIEMFKLGFAGGVSGFELNAPPKGTPTAATFARMELRFEGLSSGGKGVCFQVTKFKIGPGGLDLIAEVIDEPVMLNGIDVPFRFTAGQLEIKGGRLESASITGRGALPPKLIGEADCTVALTFGEVPGEGIVLQSGKVEIDKRGDPIVCHATRFTLTITDLDISFVKDGGYHFFYLVTGTLRFTPNEGEFSGGLLKFLDGIEMNLERTPLSADPTVLLRHISFQKALNPKKTFNLFNLFSFELRGFGFHPASPKFGGDPAVNLSGQIKFAEIGDIMQPSIEFHGLWIAPPAAHEALPRIKADGLGVDLNLKGSMRVRGAVIAVDRDTRTVEGSELVPAGYEASGFLGQGDFDIPGFGTLGANLGFLEVAPTDRPDERKLSFFFYIDKKKMAVEIPAGPLTLFLREAGAGLGFRYTLDAIRAVDGAPSLPKQIALLDEAAKRQGDLSRFSAWKPETEGDRFTLALKGVLQPYPANKSWDDDEEEVVPNPFLFDVVAAIRSDFTLFMALRGWFGANYYDYLNDCDGMRAQPGVRGYLYISAPQKRLLARMIADPKGYIGNRIPALAMIGKEEPPLRQALRAIDWSATLFVKPGLFQYELGWPNQLAVRLIDKPDLRLTVRGGMIFRAAEDGLLWGYNVEAEGYFHFSGSLQTGPLGICAEATLEARLVARLLCFLAWQVKGSLLYGLISLDATLAVNFRAWLRIRLGFAAVTIRIGFSLSLQFSAAVELSLSTSGVGARVAARIGVAVFGRTLSVGIGFTIGGGELEQARRRVERFLAMSLTAEQTDPPALAAQTGDARIDATAAQAAKAATVKAEAKVSPPTAENVPIPPAKREQLLSQFGKPIGQGDFWLALHVAQAAPGGGPADVNHAYALLVPREYTPHARKRRDGFYAPPPMGPVAQADYRIDGNPLSFSNVVRLQGENATGETEPLFAGTLPAKVIVRWDAPVAFEPQPQAEAQAATQGQLTLRHLFSECFLSDLKWEEKAQRHVATNWCEPQTPRNYIFGEAPTASDEQRVAERDCHQRNHAAMVAANPWVNAVHEARSTMMAMFLDQFVELARTGMTKRVNAHVADLGLVFYGPVAELEKLTTATISKLAAPQSEDPGCISLLNPSDGWFVRRDPVLANARSAVATDGVKLDWRLQYTDDPSNAKVHVEHLLHHYEIVRTLEGAEFTPRTMRVKPAATIGGDLNTLQNKTAEEVRLIHPDWQFVDDLADLAPDFRRALLHPAGEAEALQAAIAWAARFDRDAVVSVSYSVTPVDIAGTRGLSKSFLVEIERPEPPIRGAEAELRFLVMSMGDDSQAQRDTPPKDSLGVIIALRDPAGDGPKLENVTRDYELTRHYELIADPEDIAPSGQYGGEALTERPLGPGIGFVVTADCRVWRFERRDLSQPTEHLSTLEPDAETVKKFPQWGLFAGDEAIESLTGLKQHPPREVLPRDAFGPTDPTPFLESLWRRGDGTRARIATRFAICTVQTIRFEREGKPQSLAQRSRPMPVAIEVRIQPKDPKAAGAHIGLLRPEAFEWPVHLIFRPHGSGQVRAQSGFAHFRVPPAYGDFPTLLNKQNVDLVRDAERRILTEISFDAALAKDQPALADVHRTAVAGYDLHELDIDDLARLDTGDELFASSVSTWSRARRVSRIERVSRAVAMQLPDVNNDWQGWQAHYPSETWRLASGPANGHDAARGDRPIRSAWYSPAESTLRFPERGPRVRLLPTVPEAAIAELMAGGPPTELIVALTAEKDSPAAAMLARVRVILRLCDVAIAIGSGEAATFARKRGTQEIWIKPPFDNLPFTIQDLRLTLLRLSWTCEEGEIEAALNERHALDGLMLSIKANGGRCVSTTIQIAPPAALHPLLQEVVGELEYRSKDGRLYRAYTVMLQPVQPGKATDLAGFLAATDSGTDPYGWAALHQLGLAVTLKLYDRDQDEFLYGRALLERIEPVMANAVARYRAVGRSVGAPFVDVLLRPGRDRVSGPFDAVIDDKNTQSNSLSLDDDLLALVQISLRPEPEQLWRYFRVELQWQKANWPTRLEDQEGGTRVLRGYELQFQRASIDYDVLCVDNRSVLSIAAEGKEGGLLTLPLVGAPKGEIGERTRALTLVFRYPAYSSPDWTDEALRPKLCARILHCLPNQLPQEKLIELKDLVPVGSQESPTDGIVAPDGYQLINHPGAPGGADAYSRFAPITPEGWAAMASGVGMKDEKDAPADRRKAMDDSRKLFAVLADTLRATQPDFAWPPRDGPIYQDYKAVMGAYLTWSQRFLDHGAAPPDDKVGAVRFALAAPIKANPWRLTADHNGQMGLSFLHADRWAHARAYAVRATPRYQNLAAGAGCYGDDVTAPDKLTTALTPINPLGYALAVSPRTERIEPPVILGSGLAGEGENRVWEIVVARHGEEALAFSNRSLFARLGTEGTALSFVREYREPLWPVRLEKAFKVPLAECYPLHQAGLPTTPSDASAITADELCRISGQYPSLWKGADIWRIGNMPSHYRLTMLAVARAGLVVSKVVKSVLHATPRRDLDSQTDLLGNPTLKVCEKDGDRWLQLDSLRLVAHEDMTVSKARTANAKENDVKWWPDPDIAYSLLRYAEIEPPFKDEDASIRLVARPDPSAPPSAPPEPIVVRCRGTRFEAKSNSIHLRRDFILSFGLALRSGPSDGPSKLRIVRPLDVKPDMFEKQRNDFNKAAGKFAQIETMATLRIAVKLPVDTADAEIQASALRLAGAIDKLALEPQWSCVAERLRRWVDDWRDKIATIPPSELRVLLETPTAESFPIDPCSPQQWTWGEAAAADPPKPTIELMCGVVHIVTLNGLPTDDEANKLNPTADSHPAVVRNGPLWRLCRERLMGAAKGFKIRAVDGRSGIERTDENGATWSANGVVEVDVTLPAWVAWGIGDAK